jgi:hypothetical protein
MSHPELEAGADVDHEIDRLMTKCRHEVYNRIVI